MRGRPGRPVCQHDVRKALATIRGEGTPAHAVKTAWRHLEGWLHGGEA